tara:strand:+ start:327 stop:581 length:255 start_codon:yes stop_codon:yes gene_type:complete
VNWGLPGVDPRSCSFNEFLAGVALVAPTEKAMRYGQTFFNTLDWIRPHLADEIRGTMRDPFYRDWVDEPTLVWLEAAWDEPLVG